MRSQIKFSFFIILLFILNLPFYIPTIYVAADEELPLSDLRPGWDVLTIYEIPHPPGPICVGENGDLFYGDNLNHVIMTMDEFGVHTEYIQTGTMTFDAIGYQPNYNQLIGVTDHGFYSITSSEITLLQNYTYGFSLSTITINPTNDSYYCGSLFDNTDILYFDADGNYLSSVLSNVRGCSQVQLNNNQSIIYYSETYLGSLSVLNLTSLETQVLRTDIGLHGTQEVIGIDIDDNDDLYCMTADGNNRGFYKYDNGFFVLLMASKAGMSALTWSSQLQAFIAGGSFGGCLISYDPNKSEAELLTPIVNSYTIIETHNGTILYGIEDEIYQVNQSGPTFFSKLPNNFSIVNLIVDMNNQIFGALGNDSVTIIQMNHDGSVLNWFNNEIHETTKSIHYDEKYDDIILLTEDAGKNETYVYRIPVDDPMAYNRITTFKNSTKTAGVIDVYGNIYIYEGYNNSLTRIPDGTIDKELITTSFVNFTDIYGPDVIVVPTLGYSSVENGILIGRNDDLHIWLLDEGYRTIYAINDRGIDNSAIFQNINQEIICTQSTLILKLIYQEPPQNTTTPTPSQTDNTSFFIIQPILITLGIAIYIRKMKKKL
ncbi:MAG: hypothetical protein JJE41_07995 [Candidatus Heimdallarchaeota archaeon]|nr:hypothetical protein [Candidatus Heimdallarchaeota archaeon]